MQIHRLLGVGLAAVLCSTSTTVSAQRSGREPAHAAGEIIAIDACVIAPAEQLGFLVAANLERLTQPPDARGAKRLTLRSASVDGATCAPFRTSLQARLTVFMARSTAADSVGATMRFTADWAAQARFLDSGKPRSASTRGAATLCVRDIEIVSTESQFGAQLDRSLLRVLLLEELRRQCVEITSLVFVFLERGGTLGSR